MVGGRGGTCPKLVIVVCIFFAVLENVHQLATIPHVAEISLDTPQESRPSLRMAHVWSPYVVRNTKETIFAPLDQAQNLTWASILRAQQHYQEERGETIKVICAILWMDVDRLTRHDPPLCQPENTVILNRSSHTEYPEVQPPIHYPFVQDLLTATQDYDYLLLTNSDIVLTRELYVHVRRVIDTYGYDAFRVNRRTIPQTEYEKEPLSSVHLPWIENTLLRQGKYHPGTDCFVMHQHVVQRVDLGNMFVGNPPWAKSLLRYLMMVGTRNFKSYGSEYGWTYHLGDERSWSYTNQSIEISEATRQSIRKCFVMPRDHRVHLDNRPAHWLQNVKTCGELSTDLKSCQLVRTEEKLLLRYYAAKKKNHSLSSKELRVIQQLVPRTRLPNGKTATCFLATE